MVSNLKSVVCWLRCWFSWRVLTADLGVPTALVTPVIWDFIASFVFSNAANRLFVRSSNAEVATGAGALFMGVEDPEALDAESEDLVGVAIGVGLPACGPLDGGMPMKVSPD